MGAYWGQARDLQRSEQNRTPPGRLSRHSATRMPELPEVEATRCHLVPVLEGATIIAALVRRPRMVRRQERPGDFADRITGRRVEHLRRRGKFLLAGLEGDITWVTHLGMSGRLSVHRHGEPEVAHTNVVVGLDRGVEVRMVDPRTFGFVAAFTPDELDGMFNGRIGPDALDSLPNTRRHAPRTGGEGDAGRHPPRPHRRPSPRWHQPRRSRLSLARRTRRGVLPTLNRLRQGGRALPSLRRGIGANGDSSKEQFLVFWV